MDATGADTDGVDVDGVDADGVDCGAAHARVGTRAAKVRVLVWIRYFMVWYITLKDTVTSIFVPRVK